MKLKPLEKKAKKRKENDSFFNTLSRGFPLTHSVWVALFLLVIFDSTTIVLVIRVQFIRSFLEVVRVFFVTLF